MAHLPEPRRYGGGSVPDDLAQLAGRAARADPLERPRAVSELQRALEDVLARRDEARIAAAFRHAQDAESYRALADALGRAVETASTGAGHAPKEPWLRNVTPKSRLQPRSVRIG